MTARSKRARGVAEGDPVVVGRDGAIFTDRLLAEHMSKADLLQALRKADCAWDEMRLALLEADGPFRVHKRRPKD